MPNSKCNNPEIRSGPAYQAPYKKTTLLTTLSSSHGWQKSSCTATTSVTSKMSYMLSFLPGPRFTHLFALLPLTSLPTPAPSPRGQDTHLAFLALKRGASGSRNLGARTTKSIPFHHLESWWPALVRETSLWHNHMKYQKLEFSHQSLFGGAPAVELCPRVVIFIPHSKLRFDPSPTSWLGRVFISTLHALLTETPTAEEQWPTSLIWALPLTLAPSQRPHTKSHVHNLCGWLPSSARIFHNHAHVAIHHLYAEETDSVWPSNPD